MSVYHGRSQFSMAVTRRLLFRYSAIFVSILVFTAWARGWLSDRQHDVITQILQPTARKWVLPLVYMERDITNTSILLKQKNKIPKIIHQTWKSYSIPSKFVPLVRTWLKVNPDYEYWFWTDKDADRFVKTYYPEYHKLYTSYPQNIYRADAIRYFILYKFGGWYADMDIEALKPIDEFSNRHQCLISQEPWAHTKMFWGKDRLACNALMAARPGHPFFELVIKELPVAFKKFKDLMSRTGPKLIDNCVTAYEKKYGSNYSMNMTLYLAEPNAFLPTLANNALTLLKKKCASRQLDKEKQIICDELKAKNYANDPPKEAFTNHVWVHTYYGIDEKKNEDLFNLVPNAKKINEMLDQMEKKSQSQSVVKQTESSQEVGHGF